VFETDSVTNIAHQLGYFETVTGSGFFDEVHSRVAKVTAVDVSEVARRRLRPQNRTVGWFQPEQKTGQGL
jgi:zinc protease